MSSRRPENQLQLFRSESESGEEEKGETIHVILTGSPSPTEQGRARLNFTSTTTMPSSKTPGKSINLLKYHRSRLHLNRARIPPLSQESKQCVCNSTLSLGSKRIKPINNHFSVLVSADVSETLPRTEPRNRSLSFPDQDALRSSLRCSLGARGTCTFC